MTENIVHVVPSFAVARLLLEAELPGEVVTYNDSLDAGPVLPGSDEDVRMARTVYWATRLGRSGETVRAEMADADAAIDAAAADADEVVLWFDHDLHSQLALVRLIARIAARPRTGILSVVSIDRHPDVDVFRGLEQLEPHQLAALWPRRTPVARDVEAEATATWISLIAADPRALPFVARRIKAMPFLAAAIDRHLEEFPDRGSGLSRNERAVLAAAARGSVGTTALLRELHVSDVIYVATDVVVEGVVGTMKALGYLDADGGITSSGNDVLAAREDRVATHGIDTWRGGVHLHGTGAVWRWDVGERRLLLA